MRVSAPYEYAETICAELVIGLKVAISQDVEFLTPSDFPTHHPSGSDPVYTPCALDIELKYRQWLWE